ncbi:hypothetical protein M231_02153 [Tremella mesenterica]|uniref:VHS domain-containing protein n=1 Tax=Tremella mesenterica TaxID=5217 RepID=A0A4Q1BRA4_TREME|nr:hypothetical protein M231_02153 [Tremella mesenterica]
MSQAGKYLKSAMSVVTHLEEGKPHSSITDWVEVLSSDRYDELSLDGIPELVESINLQAYQGTTEAARAIRKKLKYGNVHRQLRALVILRALTENAGKGFQLGWANSQLMDRLKDMAQDNLLDPKVKKRLIMVFHAWSLQYKDEPRMQNVANLYRLYGGGGPTVRHASSVSHTAPSTTHTKTSSTSNRGAFADTEDIFSHDWAPSTRGPDTYADLAAAKADAEARKSERERRILMEQREAEIERRERELKRKQEMAALESRRQQEALEEQERRRNLKEAQKKGASQPKRPKFDFVKEKPQILVSVANAIQAANNLVNSCRLINREHETVLESPKVQENLDKAKAARRVIIRYIQLVNDEEFVGTLLEANEKVVEAIQLYDKLSKPAVLDSDSDSAPETPAGDKDLKSISKKLEAQRLEADRTGELQRIQERQKWESAKRQQRRAQRQPTTVQSRGSDIEDLQDLDFGGGPVGGQQGRRGLQPPLRPDSDEGSLATGSLSDFSDYDSSDEEWRRAHGQPSTSRSAAKAGPSTVSAPTTKKQTPYAQLDDEPVSKKGLLDADDPFGDPFADDDDTPAVERPRMQWAEV